MFDNSKKKEKILVSILIFFPKIFNRNLGFLRKPRFSPENLRFLQN